MKIVPERSAGLRDMKWKSATSLVLSLASICAQCVGLSYASLGMTAVASGDQAPESAARIAGFGSTVAMILAIAALVLAIASWPKESAWMRVLVVCASAGAMLWSLVVV